MASIRAQARFLGQLQEQLERFVGDAVLRIIEVDAGRLGGHPLAALRVVEKEKPAYDAFMLSRANRPNIGPYSLLLHMPEMAQRLEALRVHLRDEASLSQKLQELVMISVAREMSCAFIWYAHAAAARQAGVRDDIVDNIREKRALANLDPDEQTVVDFTRELLQNRKVSRPPFDAATARFGQRGVMTLTTLIATYAVLAYNMNTYELEAPAHPTEKALTT